jgi:hypothetical protein
MFINYLVSNTHRRDTDMQDDFLTKLYADLLDAQDAAAIAGRKYNEAFEAYCRSKSERRLNAAAKADEALNRAIAIVNAIEGLIAERKAIIAERAEADRIAAETHASPTLF